MTSPKWSAFDLAEACQLARAVAVLNDLEVFASQTPFTAKQLAAKHSLDPKLLSGVLEYVARRTLLLQPRARETFVASRASSRTARFLIDLYVGAYGGSTAELARVLRDPAGAPASVDRVRHARAFAALDSASLGVLPDLIKALEFNCTLDLGCGNGNLLLELAGRNPSFMGWGIDSNRAMLKIARNSLRGTGLQKRITFLPADCRQLRQTLPESVRSRIQSITCCNVANEMFGRGDREATKWFRELRKIFPGRLFLNSDYYGRLGYRANRRSRPAERETLLHDYVQLISGQGVPPPTRTAWRSIYAQAGCRLVHVVEDTSTTRFIHIVAL
jgi:SAM-dependent methyltransferase